MIIPNIWEHVPNHQSVNKHQPTAYWKLRIVSHHGSVWFTLLPKLGIHHAQLPRPASNGSKRQHRSGGPGGVLEDPTADGIMICNETYLGMSGYFPCFVNQSILQSEHTQRALSWQLGRTLSLEQFHRNINMQTAHLLVFLLRKVSLSLFLRHCRRSWRVCSAAAATSRAWFWGVSLTRIDWTSQVPWIYWISFCVLHYVLVVLPTLPAMLWPPSNIQRLAAVSSRHFLAILVLGKVRGHIAREWILAICVSIYLSNPIESNPRLS